MERLYFASDYMEGAHPNIIKRLAETNLQSTCGYGFDGFCDSAKSKILQACGCPEGEVFFLIGGTQTNATVIDAVLRRYQGVLCCDSGHVGVHEAGAIEFCGHKVLTVPNINGKITAAQIDTYLKNYYSDGNWEHMVMPGMVYISQTTEYGTMYSLAELEAISAVCRENNVPLFLDGARLAYALGSRENDVGLKDIARLCDVFYIGGTKCGALLGEAVVFPKKGFVPHFFTMIKQHGALLAKGRVLGIQFDELFTDGLYEKIGIPADRAADRIREALKANGYELYMENATNQVFCRIENALMNRIGEYVEFGFTEVIDENHSVIRFAPSWAVSEENVDRLIEILKAVRQGN